MKRPVPAMNSLRDARGFTLVEILVTLALVSIMMAAVYGIYLSNVRAVKAEEDRVEIQQDQRISLDFMARELRIAGYDKAESLLPTIVDARSNFIYFTADRNDDGDVDDANEHIAFCLFNSPTDGLALAYVNGADNTVGQVGTPVAGGALAVGHTHPGHQHETFARVEAMEFYYTLEDGTQTTSPGVGQMDSIRSVEVTILARAADIDTRWTDTQVYTTPSGVNWGPYNDNTRRRLVTANIVFRNMGLN